jgi:hypothetical protein
MLPGRLCRGGQPGSAPNRSCHREAQNITGADIIGISDPGTANWCADGSGTPCEQVAILAAAPAVVGHLMGPKAG